MKIAILSDIHSNIFALKNSFNFLEKQNIDHYLFLGDYFGYYPWAIETFELLMEKEKQATFLIGNHDLLIITDKPKELPEYYHVIKNNKKQLPIKAIDWLKKMPQDICFEVDGCKIIAMHGTPDDKLNGRYYPDNVQNYPWLPIENEVLILGHTHYPILKINESGGILINPGSIGQSRDGDISSSFCIFDTKSKEINFHRVEFDSNYVINELEKINWYERAIKSLKKRKNG